jgi:hypothetical protein
MLLKRFALAVFGVALCAPVAVDAAQPPGSLQAWQSRSMVSSASDLLMADGFE